MMLLDEPFSNLDVGLRAQVRDLVLHVLKSTTSMTVMVTHDSEEAMFMADRIAVMREGRIVQQGIPEQLYNAPVDGFVMRLFGEVNRIEGRVVDGHVETALGLACAPGLPAGAPAEVLVPRSGLFARPTAVTIASSFFSVASSNRVRFCLRSSARRGLRHTIRRSPGKSSEITSARSFSSNA